MNKIQSSIISLVLLLCCLAGYGQPGAEIEVKKPTKYENRKLPAEKTGEKKFTLRRRLYQNMVTHYNYYFNANNRLNEIVSTAKNSFRDDYSQLLPFYNYSLDVTSQNKRDLDSVVYKCTAGILLHDLRNSYIDNLYLLLAKAYFFRKDMDSAGLTLQYINFSYAPKEEGNYDIPIGSNASNDNGEFSISTKEKNNIFNKLTSRQPSRNESFLWQIRTNIEKDELPEASGLIEILRHDPNFPERLQTGLHEMEAYWFYKQQVYDSAAVYLTSALGKAPNNQEKARWEYLIAQMYQLAKKNEEAVNFYNRSISHTNDPVMDVYARLNSIRIHKTDNKNYLQENIDALLSMAKKDKYQSYRDIIYYATASIELERNNVGNAQDDLLKSVKYSVNNPLQRSQSFLLLADINYNKKSFPESYNFYDSTDINILPRREDRERAILRKPPLKTIADNTFLIHTQDSLQALAKLTPAERDAIIKKRVKLLRRAQGLKEEETTGFNPAVKQQQAPDLFGNNDNSSSDFYFYSASQKARGFSDFKSRWGERQNVDNWQRKSSLDRQAQKSGDVDDAFMKPVVLEEQKAPDNSYEGLQQNIPLSEEKLDASNKSIMNALFTLGQTYSNKLEEYPSAIEAYEELLRRFPNSPNKQETLFNLVYAYEKTGNKVKSDQYKNQLTSDTANSKWAKIIRNPEKAGKNIQTSPATKQYENIYNLFIEGKFDQAKNEKKIADSLYGNSFWTPQLLFIESIYYIKQQQDTTAIRILTDLSSLYNGNPMAGRAKTMIDVLKRRKEIESYLTKLDVTRNETEHLRPTERPAITTKSADTTLAKRTVVLPDTSTIKKIVPVAPPKMVVKNFSYVAADSQYVVVLLDKVDPVYASEARNAFNRFNREKFYNQKIDITGVQLDERYNLVLQGPFVNAEAATDYIEKVRPVAKSRILPWLSAEKYTFILISNANLDLLKSNKDMDSYKQLLQKAIPGKF